MKITFLTAGTGSYYCGACMRDNALVNSLIAAGHEATLLPMYLPLMLDEPSEGMADETPVFFGGINVYLQQKYSFFRHTPSWLDRWIDAPSLLRAAAKRSHMTSPRDHGEMTLKMLTLDSELFAKELEKLYQWIEQVGPPDVLCLSNALFAGFARELKKRWDIPVYCFFQGEDLFLDSLPPEYCESCWQALRDRVADSTGLIAPSVFYAREMERRLQLAEGTITVLPNGISLKGYEAEPLEPTPLTIGYLARLCPDKGLGDLVEAFIRLRELGGGQNCRLKIAGTMTDGDIVFVEKMKTRLASAGLSASVEWLPNLSRSEKIDFLKSLTLFSVPTRYPEAFGLYVIEALAAGVPVVQPEAASFPEIVETTEGGLCYPPGDVSALASIWQHLLTDAAERQKLAGYGQAAVRKKYSADAMRDRFLQFLEA